MGERSRLSFLRRHWGSLLVVLLVVGYLALEVVLGMRVRPPQRVMDFESFLEWRPSTDRFAVVDDREGEDHLITYGAGGGVLPSGPSAYVFGRSGGLEDWSRDIGDDSTFRQRWPQLPRVHDLTVEEAREWMAAYSIR
jgi:hypothetical protein